MWVQLMLDGHRKELRYIVELDLRRFRGRLGMLAPRGLFSEAALKEYKRAPAAEPQRWVRTQRRLLTQWMKDGRFSHRECAAMLKQLGRVQGQPLVLVDGEQVHRLSSALRGRPQPLFLRIDPPQDAKPGWRTEFDVRLLTAGRKRVGGGSVYRVEMVPKPAVTRRWAETMGRRHRPLSRCDLVYRRKGTLMNRPRRTRYWIEIGLQRSEWRSTALDARRRTGSGSKFSSASTQTAAVARSSG